MLAEAASEARGLAEEAADLERMTLALRGLDAQENRLYERWDAGDISKNVYKTQTTRIATQRRHAEH